MQISISHETSLDVSTKTISDLLDRKILGEDIYGNGFHIEENGDVMVYSHFLPEEEPQKLRKATMDEIALWKTLNFLRKEYTVVRAKNIERLQAIA